MSFIRLFAFLLTLLSAFAITNAVSTDPAHAFGNDGPKEGDSEMKGGFAGKGGKGGKGSKAGKEASTDNESASKDSSMRNQVAFYFPGYDTNGDGHLDKGEWKRRGNFERLDADGNGTIEPSELAVLYGAWGRKGPMTNPILPSERPSMDSSVENDLVSHEKVGKETLCGITRVGIPDISKCQNGDEIAVGMGLFETGVGPVFPAGAFCHGIDEIFALPYTDKTGRGAHGGIDLPTEFGTPMLAAAAGTVVGKFDPEVNARGKTIVLRHSPEDTGLPFWVYTEYGHLDAMPKQEVGQRVRMGEVLGPTGNSGMSKNQIGKNKRRPGVHFAVYFSESPKYAMVPSYIVPQNGRWMDPNALYRKRPPYDSTALKALPDTEKDIPVAVMYLDGAVEPAGTKLIWPYACKRD